MPDESPNVSLRPRPPVIPVLVIAAVVACVPLVMTSTTVSWDTIDGKVVNFVYRDTFALACGAVAALTGIASALLAMRAKARGLAIGSIAVALVGCIQIARGFGLFASLPTGG